MILKLNPRGGGVLSRFQFYSPKKIEFSNLHPSKSTPLAPALGHASTKTMRLDDCKKF